MLAAKQATSKIPIVFAVATDPVGTGLVQSLARPGANVTGLSYQGVDLSEKRLELLRELVRQVARVAILADAGSSGGALEMREVQGLAQRLGMEGIALPAKHPKDIAYALETLKGRADALYVCAGPLDKHEQGSDHYARPGCATTNCLR